MTSRAFRSSVGRAGASSSLAPTGACRAPGRTASGQPRPTAAAARRSTTSIRFLVRPHARRTARPSSRARSSTAEPARRGALTAACKVKLFRKLDGTSNWNRSARSYTGDGDTRASRSRPARTANAPTGGVRGQRHVQAVGRRRPPCRSTDLQRASSRTAGRGFHGRVCPNWTHSRRSPREARLRRLRLAHACAPSRPGDRGNFSSRSAPRPRSLVVAVPVRRPRARSSSPTARSSRPRLRLSRATQAQSTVQVSLPASSAARSPVALLVLRGGRPASRTWSS